MPINWFTVVAEAINFLVLVWLLKRFLYKPILDAIDAREKGIAAKLAEAEAKKAEALKDRDEFQHKNEVFDKDRAALLKKATDDANAERQRLFDNARKDADMLRSKRQEALQDEQRHLIQEIVRWTQNEVFAITRKTLTDLANVNLEDHIGEVFVERLRSMTVANKEQLVTAVKTNAQSVRVRSAFELPAGQRNAIESAIKRTVSAETQIQFETVPYLVSGIELSANGQKVAWSIADYLTTLEKRAGELLLEDTNTNPDSAPDSKSKTIELPDNKPDPKPGVEAGPKPKVNDKREPILSDTRADR